MKKILIVGNSVAIGGAQKQQFLLMDRLKDSGFEVEFCYVYNRGASVRFGFELKKLVPPKAMIVKGFAPHKVKVSFISPKRFFWTAIAILTRNRRKKRLKEIIVKGNFDWIIPFSNNIAEMAVVILDELTIKPHMFYNLRGGDLKIIDTRMILLAQNLGHKFHLLSNAQFSLSLLKSFFRIDRGIILRNFVTSAPVERKEIKLGNWVHIANYFKEKDFETLFGAIKILNEEYSNIQLHVFCMFRTKGDYQEFLAQVKKNNLNSTIKLYFRNEDKWTILRSAELGLLATHSEGCSNTLLEYMSLGLPFVSSNIEANRELLQEKLPEILYTPGSAKDMALTIKRVLVNPDTYEQLSESLQKIFNEYTVESERSFDSFKNYLLMH